jgi:hypothetical protein
MSRTLCGQNAEKTLTQDCQNILFVHTHWAMYTHLGEGTVGQCLNLTHRPLEEPEVVLVSIQVVKRKVSRADEWVACQRNTCQM